MKVSFCCRLWLGRQILILRVAIYGGICCSHRRNRNNWIAKRWQLSVKDIALQSKILNSQRYHKKPRIPYKFKHSRLQYRLCTKYDYRSQYGNIPEFPPPPGGPGSHHYRGFTIAGTQHLVGLLLTSDQRDAESRTWQHTTLTRHIHPFPRRDSNPSVSTRELSQTHALGPRSFWDRYIPEIREVFLEMQRVDIPGVVTLLTLILRRSRTGTVWFYTSVPIYRTHGA